MTIRIEKSRASGTVTAPPSKSASHRALICGALSECSVISGISDSEDVAATLRALEAMGTEIKREGSVVILGGLDPRKAGECTLDCGESGSTLRFFIPLCLLSDRPVTLTGSEKLLSRPLAEYEELCAERGFLFRREKGGVTVKGALECGDYGLSLGRSSQFMTGLLFALSCLEGESTVEIRGRAESLSYVALTVQTMKKFGVDVQMEDSLCRVKGGKYKNRKITVEGDCSNAAFLDALNFLGGQVSVEGLSQNTVQGDRVYPLLFEKIKKKETVDLSDCPDLAPVLFALSAYSGGGHFTGTARLRLKESDRILAMKTELEKMGVSLSADENSVTVGSEGLKKPLCRLFGHNDHRIVMALSLLLTVYGGEIEGAEAVAKSYPDFFEVLKKLNVRLEGVKP